MRATSPPDGLSANPRLSRWLTLRADGRVQVRSGKVELGQGVLTALAQIVADGLDVDPSRIDMVPTGTVGSPDEGYTAGSVSIQHSGWALQRVCVQARQLYLASAAARLDAPVGELTVEDGTMRTADGRSVTYWELEADRLLDRDAITSGELPTPPPGRLVGTSLPRLDVPDKVTGRRRFLHDLRPSGLLHGRVLRPPSRGARLLSADVAPAAALPGVVAVHRDGSFLGVIADREEIAVRAVEVLRRSCAWSEEDSLPAEHELRDFVTAAPATTTVERDDSAPEGHGSGASSLRRRFSRPYLAHASLAPSAGMAQWDGGRVRVWSHSQGVFQLRRELARTLRITEDDVAVQHVEGAGCYGHNAADDAAYDATLLARVVPGRPVLVVWSRADELSWGPLGPAMVVDVRVDLDVLGAVTRWTVDVRGGGHASRPGAPGAPPLLADTHIADARPPVVAVDPPPAFGGGNGRNAVPLYALPSVSVRVHRLETMPLRTSALRALGAHLNVFAIESVVDELAERAGVDPVEYRRRLLPDERARAVLEAAASRSGWGESSSGESRGRGVGLARYKNNGAYCAVVADVEAEDRLLVRRLTIAVDVGRVVNPDGVVNQIEGGALQAVSVTTLERVPFDRRRVTSSTWDDYPVLRFSHAPEVDVVLLDRPDAPPVGAGEAATGPTAAALANALYDAIGVRVRDLPLTPENITAALGDAEGD